MTPEIIEQIKKLAERKYPDAPQFSNEALRDIYTSGQIDAIEMMIGFVEWIRKNYTDGFDGTWHKEIEPCVYQSFTTIELLKKFFKL